MLGEAEGKKEHESQRGWLTLVLTLRALVWRNAFLLLQVWVEQKVNPEGK